MRNMLSRIGTKVARGAGHAADQVRFPNRGVMALGAIGVLGMGIGDSAGSAASEAMMEIGLGDPEADKYFLGGDSSFRYLAGSMIGGPVGGMMRASAPQDYFSENPYTPTTAVIMGAPTIGTVTGAGAGFGLAQKALSASDMGFGKKSLIKGTASIVGASAGLSFGVGATAVAPVVTHASQNSQFLSQSPYSASRSTAASLNASGNIVLGMHNSRRGY